MSTRVDYYLLDQADPQAVAWYACRLLNKAYQAGMRVFVLTDTAEQSRSLNSLLWASSDANFIPHALAGSVEATDPLTKICIGHTIETSTGLSTIDGFDMLVNMQTGEVPSGTEFTRVAELVSADEAHKNAARKRYTVWRSSGAEQNMHNIKLN